MWLFLLNPAERSLVCTLRREDTSPRCSDRYYRDQVVSRDADRGSGPLARPVENSSSPGFHRGGDSETVAKICSTFPKSPGLTKW